MEKPFLLFVMSKTQTELFVSKWQTDNFGDFFCWKKKLSEIVNWIVFFLKEKITLKHLKTVRSSNARVRLWAYNKPLKTVCWKTPIFQSKQPMTKYISLNSSFTVVLNGIICFSVRICDNSLFSFTSKKLQGFSSDRKILVLLLSLLFHLQNRVSVFWNLNS